MRLLDRVVALTLPAVPKPVARIFARPYIAGETIHDQMAVVKLLNDQGFMVATSILGEFVTRREESEEAVRDYEKVLATVQERRLDSNIHVKLTHLGLKLDKEFCYRNVRRLVRFAGERSNFVRIDMEDSSCTDDTLEIYARLREQFDNVGCVLQARLRRSLADARELAKARANVRVCKGIYLEPYDIAYPDPELIRSNFTLLVEELLGAGCYVGIATHDERLLWDACRAVERLGLDPSRYEFQMLHGVETTLRRIVREAGHRLRVAVPFGPSWYAYSLRRFRENPQIAGHVFRALFKPS
ncbi:MAG: proline dehydrogenase family protein [Acidobacteriota bacterium]